MLDQFYTFLNQQSNEKKITATRGGLSLSFHFASMQTEVAVVSVVVCFPQTETKRGSQRKTQSKHLFTFISHR
jgi:hypothetical protein